MSANEKKLADFILDNASLIRDYSSQQIAAAVGVSQSSVVKFSQKIGYRGFTDLKLAIHESVVKQESNVSVLTGKRVPPGDDVELKDQLYHVKCEALSSATALTDDKTLRAVAAGRPFFGTYRCLVEPAPRVLDSQVQKRQRAAKWRPFVVGGSGDNHIAL